MQISSLWTAQEYSTAMKLTCMLLKHILSILVFGDDIMCPHPSNNAKNRSMLLILKIANM